MNNYHPLSESQIDTLLNEPWLVTDKPYLLFAAFALSSLWEAFMADDSDEMGTPNDMWGQTIPKKLFDRFMPDVVEDFCDGVANAKPISIWGRKFSIRKTRGCELERLPELFDFPIIGGEYVIIREGILDLSGESRASYEMTTEESSANRTYLRKIVKLAEDDENNGWDALTDMEVVLYCWAQYCMKHGGRNYLEFKNLYRDFILPDDSAILSCLNSKAASCNRPTGAFSFSHQKVSDWNLTNCQKSIVSKIPKEEADDYWFDVALKTSFKAKNQSV